MQAAATKHAQEPPKKKCHCCCHSVTQALEKETLKMQRNCCSHISKNIPRFVRLEQSFIYFRKCPNTQKFKVKHAVCGVSLRDPSSCSSLVESRRSKATWMLWVPRRFLPKNTFSSAVFMGKNSQFHFNGIKIPLKPVDTPFLLLTCTLKASRLMWCNLVSLEVFGSVPNAYEAY